MDRRSQAFDEFVNEHFESTQRGMAVALGEPGAAEDATRAAFARAYTRWRAVRRTPRPEAWLFVAASRAALRRPPPGSRDSPTSAEATMERAVETLSDHERHVIVLHHYARLSTAEIARALRCPPESVTFTLREAHRHLGVEPDDDTGDDLPEVQIDAP